MTIPNFTNTVTPFEEALAEAVVKIIENISVTHTLDSFKEAINSAAEAIVGLPINIPDADYDFDDQLLPTKPLENIIGKTLQDHSDTPNS